MQETFTPIIIDPIGSLFANGPIEKTPDGYASEVKNCKFISSSVRMRFGLTTTASSIDKARITGLANFVLFGGAPYLMSFNSAGRLERELDQGKGNMESIQSNLGVEIYADMTQAYEQMFMALSPLTSAGAVSPKSYYRYNGEFFLDDVGLDPNLTPATGAAYVEVGDVPKGDRYCIVLFETRSGYLSGATTAAVSQIVSDPDGDPNTSLRIDGIPIGPSNTVKRWVAFTQAGASSSGPYYLIRENDHIFELNADITATVVPDNTSITATFNFTDDVLVSGDPVVTDDIDFFDKVKLVPQKSVFYSKSTNRMVWAGESDTIFRLSEPNDPESYFASTGFVQPGQKDGDFAVTAREWRNELYFLKSSSGHVPSVNNSHPNTWPVAPRWEGSGPSGPFAVDTSDSFMAYAGRPGLFIYDGSYPQNLVTQTMADVWARINWTFGHLIWLTIDTNEKEIHVGVPFDSSTLPDKRLTIYYGDGWDSLKWSVDDVNAHMELAVKRLLPDSPNPNTPVDSRIKTTQMLVATSEPTGVISMLDPTAINDNSNPINQRWASAFVAPKKLGVYTLGGFDVMASGVGIIQPYVLPISSSNPTPARAIALQGGTQEYSRKPVKQGERFSIIVTNNSQPDSSFTLARITVYMRYMWAVRTV